MSPPPYTTRTPDSVLYGGAVTATWEEEGCAYRTTSASGRLGGGDGCSRVFTQSSRFHLRARRLVLPGITRCFHLGIVAYRCGGPGVTSACGQLLFRRNLGLFSI
ncbi:hypothetical protein GUJ93_ZPchr0002g25461 [Zizania palustris]|uniref:Uncharacterized protein n=1 Tax=Zizania palustris TaxID=103762 RepID=A0A8J5RTX9_ZIZPA|nr:hypothetical protein GUJ93_ZPchr0002g25461 [Zizania palustris]KAG8057627.1 hypothetical protein GUJ93_ZPchr0002g25461 [Zizania palustris]KAG8057628.1 hypothetical protein GUJ93_ZPchr0002g25461 [Zizania palustris]